MKPFSSILIFSAIVLFTSSCRKRIEGSGNFITQERPVSPFTEVESDGSFTVIVKEDSIQKVTIYGEDNILPHITTRVEANRLRIYYDDDLFKKFKEHGITIRISVPQLNNVSLTGSGKVYSEGTINSTVFFAVISGSGEIDLTLNCIEARTFISGSGDISLHGTSPGATHSVSGSGDVKAFDMLSDDVDVTIGGSGNCDVHAEKTLKVKISGSGDVRYIGSPLVQTSISGSGSVKPL